MIKLYYINYDVGDDFVTDCGFFKSLKEAAQHANRVLSSSSYCTAYIKQRGALLGKVENGNFYPSRSLDASLRREFE